MTASIDAVSLGWALSALLFILSLWPLGATPARRHRHAAVAGVLVLAGVTLYAGDVVNLPEICGTVVIGGAIGLLLGRDLPVRHLPMLLTACAGAIGLAVIGMAGTAWLNPDAFGLVELASDRLTQGALGALAIGTAAGAMACAGGMAAIVAGGRAREGGLFLFAATTAMAGWSVGAAGFLLENIGLAVAGGLAGSAGSVLTLRLCRGANRKGLADGRRHP
ncbi:MAG TPA: NADP transhydrogenase subunit beta [Sphingobium sp.]|nr:NADP transhydrogenase subunit beta [Sphingobium sp.]